MNDEEILDYEADEGPTLEELRQERRQRYHKYVADHIKYVLGVTDNHHPMHERGDFSYAREFGRLRGVLTAAQKEVVKYGYAEAKDQVRNLIVALVKLHGDLTYDDFMSQVAFAPEDVAEQAERIDRLTAEQQNEVEAAEAALARARDGQEDEDEIPMTDEERQAYWQQIVAQRKRGEIGDELFSHLRLEFEENPYGDPDRMAELTVEEQEEMERAVADGSFWSDPDA